MVNINDILANHTEASNRNLNVTAVNFSNNANRNKNRAVVRRPRKRRVVVQFQPELEPNVDQDEDNSDLQGAERFKNAYIIMTLVGWVKKPSVEHDLSGILAKYNASIVETPNFIEAALIIQQAGKLYEKKVDLLMKNIMQAQLRIVKSFNIINTEELQKIEKKMRKRKLTPIEDQQQKSKNRKKRKNWFQRPEFVQFVDKMRQVFQENPSGPAKDPDSITDLFNIEAEFLDPMIASLTEVLKWQDPEFLKAEDDRYRKEYEARFIPLEEYIFRPFVEKSRYIAYESPDKDQIVRSENLLMSDHNFYHEKKCKWYEVFYNKVDPKTMMDVTVWEDAVYKHRMANLQAGNLLDLFNNYDKYDDSISDKFLMDNLREEHEAQTAAETLQQKSKRMCPYKLDVIATRLPDEILQKHLQKQRLQLSQQAVASTSAEQVEETTEEIDNNETVTVLLVSDPNETNSDNELLILTPQSDQNEETAIPTVSPALPESANSESAESEINKDSLNSSADVKNPGENNESVVAEVGMVRLAAHELQAVIVDANRTAKLRERKSKKLKGKDDDNEEAPKKKKRFKLEITKTVNFIDYERFFCSNYTAEVREGLVLPLPNLPEPPIINDLNNDEIDTTASAEEVEAAQTYVPRIPPLPTGEIITPEIRRFNELQAKIAENREERRWYYDWEVQIQELLKEQRCSKFDIHDYEKKLIDQFPTDEPEKSILFKDLVKDQPKKEVIRNFMAVIHLATSMNIDVNETTPGELCNETLQVTLLSRELHHETMMDFEAPSELKIKKTVKRTCENQLIVDQSAKKQRVQNKSRKSPIISQPVVVLNYLNLSTLSPTNNCFTGEFSEKISNKTNKTVVNKRKNNDCTSTQAKCPAISPKSPDIVRCITTIVKTPSSFLQSVPEATSTPSPRNNHLRSFDSGVFTDGCASPEDQSPRINKIRRATIEEAFSDMAGPSWIIEAGTSSSYLDDSVSNGFNTPFRSEMISGNRKRQLDFENM